MAFETRYEVRTHVLSSCPAERLPAMCGKATLAIEVSSTSMKVASVTARAIIHGLTAGRQASDWSTVAAAALIPESTPWELQTIRDAADGHCSLRDRERP